jgi:hypothetical protein
LLKLRRNTFEDSETIADAIDWFAVKPGIGSLHDIQNFSEFSDRLLALVS